MLLQRVEDYVLPRVTDDAPIIDTSPVKIRQQPKIAKVVHAIVAAKHEEGGQYYMVRYEGLPAENDEWVFSPAVAAKHVARFWEAEMRADGDPVAMRVALGLPPAAKRAKTMPSDGGAEKTALAPAAGASA